MMHTVVVLVALLAFAYGDTSTKFEHGHFNNGAHAQTFSKWQKHFGLNYASIEEESHRFAVFLENWKYISSSNDNNAISHTLGLNQFGAMTGQEFRYAVHGHSGSCLQSRKGKVLNSLSSSVSVSDVSAPASVDWTAKGKVTPVKNQGQCGSCWAFSTTGSLESASAIAGKPLTPLSEQQLVDCSGSYGNQGCNGGLMDSAFKYIKASGGLCSESEYPYTAKDGTCKSSSCGTKYDAITGYTDVTHENEAALEAAVAKGPVSIAIEADQSAFQFYTGGVMSGTCGTKLDHGVLVVGYGTASGSKFWKVKNSWGASWGESGYIRMCRDCSKNSGAGECGILDQPSYPNV